jgi:GTP cyclohydrolase I
MASMTTKAHHTIWEAATHFFTLIWGNRFDWQEDQHYKGTPERWAKMMKELTTPEEFEFTTFESTDDEMIIVKDIPFVSLCAHHMVPFVGVCHIGYVPQGKIAGLSKFARLVKNRARDLTVQEELTTSIANALEVALRPRGVAVYMEAEHMCMTIRGVQAPGTTTITSKMTGCFGDHSKLARQEFLSAIQ